MIGNKNVNTIINRHWAIDDPVCGHTPERALLQSLSLSVDSPKFDSLFNLFGSKNQNLQHYRHIQEVGRVGSINRVRVATVNYIKDDICKDLLKEYTYP